MFNALKYTKKLEEVGLTREQAETHVQIMTELIETNLATKLDIKDLRADLTSLKVDLENKMMQLEYRLIIKLGSIVTLSLAAMATIMKFF